MKRKKKQPKEDVKDPDVTYALTNSKSRTLADSMKETSVVPITDAEIATLLDRPDWIWGGMTGVVCRIFKRLQSESISNKKDS